MRSPCLYILISLFLFISCGEGTGLNETGSRDTPYFPPPGGAEWETVSISELNWDQQAVDTLLQFLENNNTRAFIVLQDGRIAIEEYWGNNAQQTSEFDAESRWYWASGSKALTAVTVGIAQQEGFLNIDQATSTYLGNGWSSLNGFREPRITIRNQMSMTTGLDYRFEDLNCTIPRCLTYLNDPGTVWYYHNAPYTLIQSVISSATGLNFEDYVQFRIENELGMDGVWIRSQDGFNNTFWSSGRDAARFGLMIEREGIWNNNFILSDRSFFTEMITPSQSLNPSYGFLWWLNGQNGIVLPGSPQVFNATLAPSAPPDLIAAMGRDGQFIDVVFSEDLVVVRLGESAETTSVPVFFHNEMWQLISDVIRYD